MIVEPNSPIDRAKVGTTVADLKKQGAAALTDAQLKALVVEKSVWLQNTVTGEKYISDEANVRIRKIDTSGNINTICGNGTRGYSGDGGPALQARGAGVGPD